ncbi:cytochrome c maturation protein CcmE [Brackiella oedipodis]|uniref:cytochrome c maturation protein CcmE n=1 Tax=Brackiella oedipodis TaxID=124225 RepID=UPI00048D0868|nr:cytochrome c maturation protein CcmE [Brackiella oedipodis]
MTKRQKRWLWLLALLVVIGTCSALVVNALRQNMVFFHTPSDVRNQAVARHQAMRVGGLVARGSLHKHHGSVRIEFDLIDDKAAIPVVYEGLLPDLFGEGQGAVLEGQWDGERFIANRVFAKHDENYMPPEVAKAATEMHNKYTHGAVPLTEEDKTIHPEEVKKAQP